MLLDKDGQSWAELHTIWSDTATDVVRSVRHAFEILSDIQFAAPWKDEAQASEAVSASTSRPAQPSGSAASRS